MQIIKTTVVVLAAVSIANSASAEVSQTLKQAVQRAVNINPEVQAKWYGFRASQEEQDFARGGYFPRIDLSVNGGYENQQDPDEADTDFSRYGGSLSLTQMIYDGFATRDEIARLGYVKSASYYKVLDAAERTALDAVRAYQDVHRQRDLVRLAQDNYDEHQRLYKQLQERVSSGYSRSSDLDQARGRLALAESNLRTEASNLHNVSARYLRVIRELPPESLTKTTIPKTGIPDTIQETLNKTFKQNPAYIAAQEEVRAAQSSLDTKQAAFHPRLDFRARQDLIYDDEGIDGRHDDSVVELVLRYNLYNGGSDSARKREFQERLDFSEEERDIVCQNLRQNVTIAYKDAVVLKNQLSSLDLHRESIDIVRKASIDQFKIGKRTLLDLLDTQNEYFQAGRSYINAFYDLELAYARTHAGLGALLKTLGVSRADLPSEESQAQARYVDPESICTLTAPEYEEISQANIFFAPTVEVVDLSPSSFFKIGKAELNALARAQLNTLAARVKKRENIKRIWIEGHTDNTGSLALNKRLSLERAKAVKSYLVQQGVDQNILTAQGYSLERPLADNQSNIGRTQNRRVEIRIESASK